MSAATPLKTRTASALGDLLRLARAGKLHGIAYAVVKEDDEGALQAGSNVIWNGDPDIEQALYDAVGALPERMSAAKPKSKLILPN